MLLKDLRKITKSNLNVSCIDDTNACYNMKDFGINMGIVQEFNTSDRRKKGIFYGFRKMFWKYLNKLHVPFHDPCCEEADSGVQPVGFKDGVLVVYDGTGWVDKDVFPTTTTTAAPTTTTTTTAA